MSETTVRIGLPLPLDVMGNIVSAIGQFYPTSQARMGYDSFDVIINDTERVDDPEVLVAAKQVADEFTLDAAFEGMSGDEMRMAVPEWFAKTLTRAAMQMFEDDPDAINSLEMVVNADTDEGVQQYVVSVAKSKGQTPLEMRLAAEAELAGVLIELDAANDDRDEAVALAERLQRQLDDIDLADHLS